MSDKKRPMRDASVRTAIGQCEYCGGNANSTLGGEHIWKCSEIVPIQVLEELADEWEEQASASNYCDYNEGMHDALKASAKELRGVIE